MSITTKSTYLSPSAKDILAGTASGVVSIIVCHPLDTIRVRLQTTNNARFGGIFDVIKQTAKKEGITAFYKGMSIPLFAQGIQKATMFFAFGTAKRTLSDPQTFNYAISPLLITLLSGGFSGFANSLVCTPIELIRNRLQVQYHHVRDSKTALYRGPIDVLSKTVKIQGITGLWTGLFPMMLRDIPGVAAWYTVYEISRRALTAGVDPSAVPAWKLMLAGATGGIAFWVNKQTVAFPQDTIKSIIQTQSSLAVINSTTNPSSISHSASSLSSSSSTATATVTTSRPPTSFFAVGRHLIKSEGIGRLWRGFPIAVLRGIPGAAITFTTYQTVMNYINHQGW